MKIFGYNLTRESEGMEAQPTQPQGQEARGGDVRGVVTHADRVQSSLTVPAFFRAITLRADTMARLNMQYQKRTTDGHYTCDYGPTRGRHFNYLLQVEPNPFTNWTNFMRQVEITRLLRGNAYIYVERDLAEEVKAFWLCQSGSYDTYTDLYTITYAVGTASAMKQVPSCDIIHLHNTITSQDGFYGMPLLLFAARTLNLAATQEAQTLDTMAKGGRHKLILQEEKTPNMGLGKVAKKEMEQLQQRMQSDLPAVDVLYVPNVATVNNITQTLSELEMSTMRKLSVADISRLTAVPRMLLGDDTNSSYKTPEAAMLDFLNNGIAPQIEEDEDEFNRKLLGEMGYGNHRFHLCSDSLLRLDRQAQGLWNKNRLETGVASINELRAELELAPIPEGGDDHYVTANVIKAGSPKLSGETTTPQEPPKKEGGQL